MSIFRVYAQRNIYVDFLYFNNPVLPGVTHSGDNRTGAGDGDDETILVDFEEIDSSVQSAVLVISCFNGSFETCQEAFCRVVTREGQELARYALSGLFSETSLIVCKLIRDPAQGLGLGQQDWILEIIGEPIGGRSIIDFFHLDVEGPMALLRQDFKRKANCMYDDSLFFQECAERERRGHQRLSSEK